MHPKSFVGRALPGPAGGAYSAPPDNLAGFKRVYFSGRGGVGRGGWGCEGRDGEVKEGKGRGGEGKGRGGKGGNRKGRGA